MRIIAGTARGRKLAVPPGKDIRPTSDRVREALFSMLTPMLPGASFLDLFAGSGANGLEAMSRGAASTVLVDNSAQSLSVARQNVAGTGLTGDIRCVHANLPADVAALGQGFDIIFADPPYAFADYEALLTSIARHHTLAEDGILLIEHARRTSLPEETAGLVRKRERRYGDTVISTYCWASHAR